MDQRVIAVDRVGFQSARHTEPRLYRVRGDSNHFCPAPQNQIGFPRFAGDQQFAIDFLVERDGAVRNAVEAVATQVFGLGLYSHWLAWSKETQKIGQPETWMPPPIRHGLRRHCELTQSSLRGHCWLREQLTHHPFSPDQTRGAAERHLTKYD
jgi:hypothetical protein